MLVICSRRRRHALYPRTGRDSYGVPTLRRDHCKNSHLNDTSLYALHRVSELSKTVIVGPFHSVASPNLADLGHSQMAMPIVVATPLVS